MRFDAGFLVALAALSHLPAGSGRVLYGFGPSARDLVDQSSNTTLVERAVVVPPPKPVAPKPITGPEAPIVPGGDRTPGAPGDNTPTEPVPLVPGDKTPGTPGDKTPTEPAPLVPGDKTPTTPTGDKVIEDPPTAGNKDIDLWCPSDALADLAKRSLEKRTGRSCGRNRHPADMRDRAVRDADYDRRGARARAMASNRPYDDIDYPSRINTNYRMERTEDPDLGDTSWEQVAPQSGYGFSTRASDWNTMDTFTTGVEDPVTRVSYSRQRRPREEDDDWTAVVAHDRFSNRDSNRWDMDELGNPQTRRNARGEDEYIPRDGWEERSVPASQLVYEGGRRNRAFGPLEDSPVTPRRMTFFSEGLSGRETRATVDESFSDLGRSGRMTLRRDSTDPAEQRYYDRLNGIDNTYSYSNTVYRNRDLDEYQPTHMDVWQEPSYLIASHYERPRRSWE